MTPANKQRLHRAALDLAAVSKMKTDAKTVLLYLLDVREALLAVERDLIFRPEVNSKDLTND